ncbi:metallophosphoesterase [Streptomyces sp. JJ38]|uniref:metallophosphoesterase n=1 Tax=Streptomyces sp. JJ38 TaxID=2738128 RepID=UPI001C59EAEF|nr:metallophosphoesterase [Streptomyces sp. JJ38]MBW1596608.1 metallophosphoesterase [Streptomyces sp. JJ38]
MIIVFLVLVVGVLGAVHYYLWRRLVRDVSRPGGGYRRAGTALAVLLPLLAVGAQVAGRAEAPFGVQQALAWPGFLWFALLVYLLLTLLVLEPVRPLARRLLARRAARRTRPVTAPEPRREPVGVSGGLPGGGADAVGGAGRPLPDVLEPQTAGHDADPSDADPHATTPGEATPVTAGRDEAARTAEGGAPDPSRRLFVARAAALTAGLVATGTVGYGAHSVLAVGPRLKRVRVPLARLPRAAHGYRIAVVSDIHIGPILGRAHTRRIVDLINGADVDAVAVVGDLVDGSVAHLGDAAEPLARLRSRDGAYFVTGNHEYFSGAEQWVDHVRELGLRPLENARVELPGFDLAGVNDVAGESYGDGPDFAAALGDRDPARASVLLAHQPVVIHDAVEHGVDLQLSGHTHGGQMWPGNLLADLANPTVAGLERYGDTQLYVTRGAGAWGPPVRVGAEPDITVVELASRQA